MNKKLFAGVAALFWRKNTVKKRHLTEGCSRRFSAEFQSRNSEFFLRFLLRDVQFFPVFQSVGKNRPFGNFIVFDHRAPQCIALQRLEQTYRVSGDGHNFIDRTNGGKIIPVIRVISEKIGPNFPQFCRSGLNVVFTVDKAVIFGEQRHQAFDILIIYGFVKQQCGKFGIFCIHSTIFRFCVFRVNKFLIAGHINSFFVKKCDLANFYSYKSLMSLLARSTR